MSPCSSSRDSGASAERCLFLVPDRDLVEALVYTARFSVLAAELGFPVPATRIPGPGSLPPRLEISTLGSPFVIKPKKLERDLAFHRPMARAGPRVEAVGAPIIAQQYVESPEIRVESYHVYVGGTGRSSPSSPDGRSGRCRHSAAIQPL
jgi:hypothetical protein